MRSRSECIQLTWKCGSTLGRGIQRTVDPEEKPLQNIIIRPGAFSHNGFFVLRAKTIVTNTNR